MLLSQRCFLAYTPLRRAIRTMSTPSLTLNDGNKIPVIAFGTGTALYAKECTDLVVQALKNGYVSLDTAQIYANTQSVGDALKKWGGKREDVYILSKWGKAESDDINDPLLVLEKMLKELNVDYVDMYLIHSPIVSKFPLAEQWKVMEKIKRDGLARSVGVSNFREEDILAMADKWDTPPAVNQIEYNPYIAHADNIRRLTKIMNDHDIKYQTYGPLGPLFRAPGGPVDSIVERIAKEKKGTPAQILLQWAAQASGGTVVTTSRNDQRQKEQLAAFSLPPLSESEVQEIAKAGEGKFHRQFMKEVWDKAKP